jgi:hypothetical protein
LVKKTGRAQKRERVVLRLSEAIFCQGCDAGVLTLSQTMNYSIYLTAALHFRKFPTYAIVSTAGNN